ncbi:MAG: hypothetical protein Q4D16_07775 [Eubacteriales bacterium]|nr:hypothetical protein [Eubacteriales bacterium]
MKNNAFSADMDCALKSRGFVAGTVGMAAAAFFSVFQQILPVFQGQYAETGLDKGFVMRLVFTALSSDLVLLVLPILCTLPFASAFLDDYKSHFIRKYLPRAGKKNYVKAKVFTTALSGGLTLFIGAILVFLVFAILFFPMETTTEASEAFRLDTQLTENELTAQKNFVKFMMQAFVFFLNGCFWSLVGGILAAVTMSRYMAYASPFILYYVLVIFSKRYFDKLYVLNPQEWINPVSDWVGGIKGVVLFIVELIITVGFLYSYFIERKLQDV